MQKKIELHEEMLLELHKVYIAKNKDYGDSFTKSLNKRGLIAAIVRMEDKMERLDSLKDKDIGEVDESLLDTALDLANYAVMTAMWIIENDNKVKNEMAEDEMFFDVLTDQLKKIDRPWGDLS